ncbi:MAG: kinase [Paludibacterium sp.]|uniref:PfkB family carbohydrate kinase n=1 Tax=Paludibacterium sp. TaxID=1917523 RepID=UPI0025E207E5|nr:PfkB family carbohydrate kinase [Paludibacterium sp.]MBV8048589.1 kinase [Paludibacterium sp.]MBV8647939.1 kinase [Paludibacterium sp.]
MPEDVSCSEYVVVIGDANIDISTTSSISMRVNGPHPSLGVIFKPGGGPRNVAENLALLGCKTYLLSVLGDDAYGRDVAQATQKAGVDLSATLCCQGQATSRSVIVNDCDGENYCVVGDMSIVTQISPQWLEAHAELLKGATAIVTSLVLSKETLAWLLTHHSDQPIFMDTVGSYFVPNLTPWLGRIHTLKLNRQETSLLSGLPFASREQAPEVAQWFHCAGVTQVVLSLGSFGFYYSNGEEAGWMNAPAVKVVNVTGAGDALLAGFAYGWLKGLPLADAARIARGCAAMTLMTPMNVHPALSVRAVDELRL